MIPTDRYSLLAMLTIALGLLALGLWLITEDGDG